MALNRFEIIGRLTRDPEIKQSSSGKSRTLITIAQDKVWKDQNGEKQKKSLFFSLVAYGKVGEILGQYLTKGSKVYLTATLEPYTKEEDDGSKTYGISLIVQDFEFIDTRPKQNSSDSEIDPGFIDDTFPG